MNKRVRIAIAAATIVGGFTMTSAGSASAAHCAQLGSPGFSYFGKDGRSEELLNVGNAGATECAKAVGNPSVRAPGQQP